MDQNFPRAEDYLQHFFAVTQSRQQILKGKVKFGKQLDNQRGKPHAIVQDVKELVREIIRRFVAYDNYYSRSHVAVDKYLQYILNLKMYRMFVDKHGSTTAHNWLYHQIFMPNLNFKFGHQRSDTCKTCDRYYILQMCVETGREKLYKLQEQSELHHRKAGKKVTRLYFDQESAKKNVTPLIRAVIHNYTIVVHCTTDTLVCVL